MLQNTLELEMALEIIQILNLILSNINPLKIWKSVNPLPLKLQILSLSLTHTHRILPMI